jgi:predicted DNA-binding antitoxin AbrB/MazE fold protein
MSITVEAIYENGGLKLKEALPFKEHEKVRITICAESNWVKETAGMIKWPGDAQTLEKFAEDVELDPQEDP